MLVSAVQQSAVSIHISSPSEPPSHPHPHPTHRGHHRALSWVPCAIQLLPTGCLFPTWQSIHVNATLSIRPILHTGQNGHKSKNIQIINADGCGEKGTLLPCWWECKLTQPLFLENRMEVPKETRNKTGPAIPLLGIYPDKNTIQEDTCTPMFTAALFTMAERVFGQPSRF